MEFGPTYSRESIPQADRDPESQRYVSLRTTRKYGVGVVSTDFRNIFHVNIERAVVCTSFQSSLCILDLFLNCPIGLVNCRVRISAGRSVRIRNRDAPKLFSSNDAGTLFR